LTSLSIAPTWLWISFVAGVIVLLLVDLSLFKQHGKRHQGQSSTKFSLIESAVWISISLLFNLWIGFQFGSETGVQFLTGYLIEKSLSVDNLFVILLVFSSFKIPAKYQHRVLFFGVLGAIVMRGLFIVVGAKLLHTFHWIFYVFGAILVITAYKFIAESIVEEVDEVRENWAVRLVRRLIPVSKEIDSDRFFVMEMGRRMATPLFLALVVIEITDLVFAVDSIPAVFSVTSDAFIAFASNILALLGLRALYFVLSESVSKFRYLKPGLAGVLGFIGFKMLAADFVKISSFVSLGVIALILVIAGGVSVLADRRDARS
jgi:tellurite resistance protein TerC